MSEEFSRLTNLSNVTSFVVSNHSRDNFLSLRSAAVSNLLRQGGSLTNETGFREIWKKRERKEGRVADKKQAVHSNLVCWRRARSLVAWVTFCWYIGAGQFNRSDSLNGVFPWECKPRVHLGPTMPTGVSPFVAIYRWVKRKQKLDPG